LQYTQSTCGAALEDHFGWSELAATNAPVQDEAVQAVLGMNQKTYPLPVPRDFLGAFSAPKFSPPTYFPPPTYLPPPTSLASFPAHSISKARESS